MQHIAVDVVRTEVFERAGHRLSHLSRKVSLGVVRQPVVLAGLICEFRLQKKIRARDNPSLVGSSQALTDAGFEVVPPLVGRVDATEACPKRELCKGGRLTFLPGGAVDEIRNSYRMIRWHCLILP